MNTSLISLCLCIFWLCVSIFVLVLGPILHPKIFADSTRYLLLGVGAGMFAVWNFGRWWSIRSYWKTKAMVKEETALRKQLQSPDAPKQVINPEFNFDESALPIRIPPHPPPPNGKT